MFPRNVHPVERIVRVMVGLGVLAIVVVGPQTPWGVLGVVPLITGLSGNCPAYTLFGFSTCPLSKNSN